VPPSGEVVGGGGWPIPEYIPRRKKVPAEEYARLRELEREEEERERALVQARSEKTRQRERERLAKAQAARLAQERLIAILAEQIAAEMQAAAGQMQADEMRLMAEDEEALLMLLVT
jgi:hypothetical protein